MYVQEHILCFLVEFVKGEKNTEKYFEVSTNGPCDNFFVLDLIIFFLQ